MKINKRKVFTFAILFIIAIGGTAVYIINHLATGVGNSIEKGTKGIYSIYKTLDSTDLEKIDSLKQEVIKRVDSTTTRVDSTTTKFD